MCNTCPAYKWAKEVKRLDGNRCRFCGSTEKLEAHHAKSRAEHPEIANDLENGITLCHRCHYTAHSGGNYTTSGVRGPCVRGITADPKEMQAFILDYIARKIVYSLPKEKKEEVKAAAAAAGESMNQYIAGAIDQRLDRDKGR